MPDLEEKLLRGCLRYLSDEGPADSAWLYRLSFRAQFTIQDSLGAWYGDSVPSRSE